MAEFRDLTGNGEYDDLGPTNVVFGKVFLKIEVIDYKVEIIFFLL